MKRNVEMTRNAVMTEDGYVFFEHADGQYLDHVDAERADLGYDSLDDLTAFCGDVIALTVTTFNTGRHYTANGQQLYAVINGDVIAFQDRARLIDGTMTDADMVRTNAEIMREYDAGRYTMPIYGGNTPEALAHDILRRFVNQMEG